MTMVSVPAHTANQALEIDIVLAAQQAGDNGISPLVEVNNKRVIAWLG